MYKLESLFNKRCPCPLVFKNKFVSALSPLRDAGNIAYWDSFTESGRDQSDELIKVLDLNIDSFAEKDENTDYDSDENDDNFGDEDEFEPKRATLTDRLSRGSGITKYNDNIDGSINFPVPQNNGKSSPIKLANQVQSKNSPAVSKSPVIKGKPQPLASR